MATGCGVGEAQQSSPPPDSSANGEDSVITVFAAASLTEAFNAIAREYQSLHPDSEVVLNFDGSQRLRTQLEHGARADVFASADWDQMEAVVDLGLTSSPAVNFASNRLAILAFAGSAGNLDIATLDTNTMQQPAFRIQLEALARPETKIVLGQGEVPIGRYTEKLLENIEAAPHLGQQMANGLRANVVSREANVRAIVQKVNLGEADAGVVYSSNASLTAAGVSILELPEPINVTAHYPIAALTRKSESAAFLDFVLSESGQKILRSYGFGPPLEAGGDTP